MSEDAGKPSSAPSVSAPPIGWAMFGLVGPGLVWCSDMIGSGEVILTTRIGSVLGIGVLWSLVLGIFLKYWIALGAARYTVCTGEGMIDMLARLPGPRKWAVWMVLVIQLLSAAISMAAIASAGGAFFHGLLGIKAEYAAWGISLAALWTAWTGGFKVLKILMSAMVAVIIIGVVYVAGKVFPPWQDLLAALAFQLPEVPEWAQAAGVAADPWKEIVPLMGWAAGGFASQVWYTYWVIGDGYGATAGRGYGRPADEPALQAMTAETARRLIGWVRVVRLDSALAMSLTLGLTLCFLVAGAGVLRPNELAPKGAEVALTLSRVFVDHGGEIGAKLFLLGGAAAMTSTIFVQLSGWPRLLADAVRLTMPGLVAGVPWKTQYRGWVVFFFITNIGIIYALGLQPVLLVKIGAVCDGLLLLPLQALWVLMGLYWVLPRMVSAEARPILRTPRMYGIFLVLAFIFFGFFLFYQLPVVLRQ